MKDSFKLLIALVIFLLGLVGCQERESQPKNTNHHTANRPPHLFTLPCN